MLAFHRGDAKSESIFSAALFRFSLFLYFICSPASTWGTLTVPRASASDVVQASPVEELLDGT
jgi:hypothetical protein